MRVLGSAPSEPNPGDMYPLSGGWCVYEGGQANQIGVTRAEVSAIVEMYLNGLSS